MKKLNKIISGAVCAAAASAGLTISARAADTVLTPQQTAALFGSSCAIEYYNSRTGVTTEYTAELVGSTLQSNLWTFNGYQYAGDTIPYNARGDITSPSQVTDNIYTSALVYRAYIPYYDTNFISSMPRDRVNLSFDFSLNLSGLSRFRTTVFPSVNYGNTTGSSGNTGAFWQVNSSLGLLSGDPVTTNNRYRYMWMYWGESTYTPDPSASARTALACYNIDIMGDSFSVSSLSIGVQHVRAISASYVYPDYGYQQEQGGYYYFLLQCPIIDGVLPETTLPPAHTTRPHDYSNYATTPANTVDLSQIEENQRVQIEIENDNRNYNAGTFDGINIIIEQLNDIYAQMQAHGEIAVDLLDGIHPDFLSSDMRADVRSALSSHTTARLPDVQSGKTFLGALFDWITQFRYVAAFAFFSLAVGFAAYVIFRG